MKTIAPAALERLERVLREASIPLTVRALARRLRVPYSTAKRRLDAFEVEYGKPLKRTLAREGRRGAKSVAYSL